MPSVTREEEKPYLMVETEELKYISDYSGLNFAECLELDCYTYKILVRDAFVYKMKQSDKGKEYLEDCWLINQTEPDRKSLREKFGGGKHD